MNTSENPSGSPRVLLVEDDRCSALLLKTVLKKDGYSVEHCADGEAALKILATNPFDAVVLDLMMPLVDGMQVLKLMRSTPEHMLTPVVLLTAAKLKIIEEEAARYRVKFYLEKTETDRLREALKEILAEKAESDGAPKLKMATPVPLQKATSVPAESQRQSDTPESAKREGSKGISRLFKF